MNLTRRMFMQKVTLGGATVIALASGLLHTVKVMAAWPNEAFAAKTLPDAMQHLFPNGQAEVSTAITLAAPDIAENGAVVPVSVSTELPNVESISIFAENNPSPLVASFELTSDAVPEVSTRMKMAKTSNIIAVVKADGKLYSTSKEVKVTIGGCGG